MCTFILFFSVFNMTSQLVGSIHDQPKENAKEKKLYDKLKALNSYHRKSGVEALLHKKSLERRAQVKTDFLCFL